ncbi:MAG: twin-arginine translocase TatA/TatE family subunit [Alphaproteobacteria bacterium]|nr:twin-arginine translocase TatA/TatE family subunit [Alphaproteobacteria bacterium]
MGSWSWIHWLIVLVVVLVLFGGGGKIPKLMRDLGQGITAFKKGLKEDKSASNNQEKQAVENAKQNSKDEEKTS